MPAEKISQKTLLSPPFADDDEFVTVDKDANPPASGTTKRATWQGIYSSLLEAALGGSDGDVVQRVGGLWVAATPETLADLTPFSDSQVADLVGSERAGTPGSHVAGGMTGLASLAVHPVPDGLAQGTVISNSAAETTLLAAALTDVLPANSVEANDQIWIRVTGTYNNDSGANRTLTFRTKLDADTLGSVTTGALADAGAGGGNYSWLYESIIRFATIGAGGSVSTWAQLAYQATSGSAALTLLGGVGFDLSVDTTQALTIDVTSQASAATATQGNTPFTVSICRVRADATL